MRTKRDAYGLLLRGLGWVEYVAGTADSGQQVSGWLPASEVTGQTVIDIREGARLPLGTWSARRAMQFEVVKAFAQGEVEIAVEPIEDPEVVRLTAIHPHHAEFRMVKDVPWDIHPGHFRTLWEGWAAEVLRAAPGARRTTEEAQHLVEQLWQEHESMVDADRTEYAPPPPLEMAQLPDPVELLQLPANGPGHTWADVVGLAAWVGEAFAAAQLILDEGGKGAKRRALEALGFRL
jgi:hypothetical protein